MVGKGLTVYEEVWSLAHRDSSFSGVSRLPKVSGSALSRIRDSHSLTFTCSPEVYPAVDGIYGNAVQKSIHNGIGVDGIIHGNEITAKDRYGNLKLLM